MAKIPKAVAPRKPKTKKKARTYMSSMVSVRIPEDLKEKLLAVAAHESKTHSDIVKELIEAKVEARGVFKQSRSEPISSPSPKTVIFEQLLDDLIRAEHRRDELNKMIEAQGGEPGFLSSGAPEHLRQARHLCDLRLKQLTQQVQLLSQEIEVVTDYPDFQQCDSCWHVVPVVQHCIKCGKKLVKTDKLFRKMGDWDDDDEDEDVEDNDG